MGLRHSRPLCGSGNTTRTSNKHPVLAEHFHSVTAAIAKGKHPVPFRTRKLSPSAPMVLRGGPRGRVGRRRAYLKEAAPRKGRAASFLFMRHCYTAPMTEQAGPGNAGDAQDETPQLPPHLAALVGALSGPPDLGRN